MVTVADALRGVIDLGLDTAPVVYFVEAHPRYGPLAREVFRRRGDGEFSAHTSVVTLSETLVRPLAAGDMTLQNECRELLLRSTAARDWSSVMPTYRTNWERRYGTSSERWADYEPAYQYGWQMRNGRRYRGRSWAEAEPELRRDWESHHDMPWDKAGRAIREAWEGVTSHA